MAIYTNGDDAPFSAPLSNLGRLKFHSSIPYLGVVAFTGGAVVPASSSYTVSLGSGVWARPARRTDLFSHGLGYAPLIVGTITTASGTTPVMCPPDCEVMSDTASVFIINRSNVDLAGVVYFYIGVTNYGLAPSGAFNVPANFAGVRLTPSRLQAGGFDTNHRYLQRDPAGAIPIVIGDSRTYGLGVSFVSGFNDRNTVGIESIYRVDGVTVRTASHRSLVSGLTPVNEGFDASLVRAAA